MQRPGIVFLVVVVVAVVAGLLYMYGPFSGTAPDEPDDPASATAASPAEAVAPTEATEPDRDLPLLAESDGVVRELVRGLSTHPEIAASLVPEDLLRRFVGAVSAIAAGRSPIKHVGHLEPAGRFRVIEADGRIEVDPRSFRRYDGLAEAFASLNPDDVAAIYSQLEPLMDAATVELGEGNTRFRPTLLAAIDVVLGTPVPISNLELVDRVQRFEFRDPDLEALSDAQKHLVRMGPENVERIQEASRELRSRLVSDSVQ